MNKRSSSNVNRMLFQSYLVFNVLKTFAQKFHLYVVLGTIISKTFELEQNNVYFCCQLSVYLSISSFNFERNIENIFP